nr:ABC transporter ATP-binding protein [Anaerosporobacter sp.]
MKKRINFLSQYMRPYRIRFVIVLLIILATTTIVVCYPYLFGKLVDALFYDKNIPTFFRIGIIYFVIYIINQVLHYCLDMMVAKLYIEFSFDIKNGIFKKVLSYKSKQLSNLNTGDIIFRMNKDADEVLSFIYSDIFYGISAFLDFSMCLGMTAFISLPLAGVSLALVILTFLVSNVFNKILKPYYEKVAKMSASNQTWLFELLNGMRDIRLLNATRYSMDKYMNKEFEIIENNKKVMEKETIADRTNVAIQVLSSICLFAVAAFNIVSNVLTLGGLIACIDYFERMVVTLGRMYARTFSIAKRIISIERIIEIHEQESEEYKEHIPVNEISKGEIIFSNVHFSYSEHKEVLENLNLHIKPRERIALVGKSGQGKSTIAELLCGLLEANRGEITIDGTDINCYNLQDLRSQIGLVNQTTAIFNDTVRYNLVFTNEEKHDDEIWNVLK